jgi:hypothetical protein
MFTAEMKKLGIITIGDDLFVTQMVRLKKGMQEDSATGILIKVNQNGSVKGTIEAIKYARAHGLQVVVSHRSGETLFAGIADLAYAVKAEGIKTGATQPKELFPDENTWVRRNKYLRLVEIAKKVADKVFGLKKEQAFIISADYIKESGIKPVSYLDKLTKSQIIVAGKNAGKIIKLLGLYGADTKDMMIAADPEVALSKAKEMGISIERTTVVLTSKEKIRFSFPVGVTLIAGDGLVPAEELGMAVYSVSKTDASRKGLETLDQKIAAKVITKETKKSLADMLSELNSGMLSFADDAAKLTEDVAKKVAQAESIKEKFLQNI